MKKCAVAFVCFIVITGAFFCQSRAEASYGSPGSASDPLVSQSYVDNKIEEIYDIIKAMEGQSQLYVEGTGVLSSADKSSITQEIFEKVEQMINSRPQESNIFEPVFAKKGQVIVGGEGTEIILRSGAASGYISGSNGISDITDGTEILNGSKVYINHLLIVPRNDGRGIKLSEDSWFIIKGPYTIIY